MIHHAISPIPLPQQIADAPDATHLLVWYTLVGRMAWPVKAWEVTAHTVTGFYNGEPVAVLPTDSAWHLVRLASVEITEIEYDETAEQAVGRDRPRDANALEGWPGTRL